MNDSSEAAGNAACCPAPDPTVLDRPLVGIEAEAEFARLAKALGHPARVRIIKLLLERQGCICGEIVDELPLSQATVSQHLKILNTAGLIRGTVDGPRICYCVDPNVLTRFRALSGFADITSSDRLPAK